MLTGRVFVPGMSVPLSPDELYPVEEEESPAKAPSIVVEIRTPEPLSVKRMPEPEVRTVHIVAPREKLGAVGEADEVPIGSMLSFLSLKLKTKYILNSIKIFILKNKR